MGVMVRDRGKIIRHHVGSNSGRGPKHACRKKDVEYLSGVDGRWLVTGDRGRQNLHISGSGQRIHTGKFRTSDG